MAREIFNRLLAPELEILEKAGERPNVRTIMLLSEAQKDAVIDYVTRGNFAQLTDRAFRDELVSWIRFNLGEAIRAGDGLSGCTSGQPALPTWLAKWIIGLVLTPKGQAETDAKNIRSSAGVAVFVSNHNDKAAWVEVGRAYDALPCKRPHLMSALPSLTSRSRCARCARTSSHGWGSMGSTRSSWCVSATALWHPSAYVAPLTT